MVDYKELINELKFWEKDKTHLIDELIQVSKEQENPNIVIEMSEILVNLGKYKEAHKCLVQIRTEDSNSAEWNYLMGICEFELYKESDHMDDLRLSLKYLLKAYEKGNEDAHKYLNKNLKDIVKTKLGADVWPENL